MSPTLVFIYCFYFNVVFIEHRETLLRKEECENDFLRLCTLKLKHLAVGTKEKIHTFFLFEGRGG